VALYARVSSVDQKNDLERQLERLKDYAAAREYHVTRTIQEIGSGLNDRRPKFLKLLTDPGIGVIVLEHRDRSTRFGFTYLEQLLAMQGRRGFMADGSCADETVRGAGAAALKRRYISLFSVTVAVFAPHGRSSGGFSPGQWY
jgi:predicted site-specific integrase-resolvase